MLVHEPRRTELKLKYLLTIFNCLSTTHKLNNTQDKVFVETVLSSPVPMSLSQKHLISSKVLKQVMKMPKKNHGYDLITAEISTLEDHARNFKCSSDFVSPLTSIISGYIPNQCQRLSVPRAQTNETKTNMLNAKSSWLDHLLWNHNPTNILKGDGLERDFAPYLKKYLSACNFFDKNYICFKDENFKSVESIHDSNNYGDPLKELKLTSKLNSFVPSVRKCSNYSPNLCCNTSRSHSNPYLQNDFLRLSNGISDNTSRSFTTLRARSLDTKLIISDSSNPRNLHRSVDNTGLLTENEHSVSKATEKDPLSTYDKLKKRDFDWMNSFSSEAVILQPSRGEFSIKKLISKTTCQERLWGLPPRQSYAKTIGPGMNDNLVQYMALKHKVQSEQKKNNFIGEGLALNQKVKKLIKTAKEKNRQFELKKTKQKSTKYTARGMLKTIKDSINLKPMDILKAKEKTVRNNETINFQKVQKKKSILNFRLPVLKVKKKQKNFLQGDKPLKQSPVTEYQSSASYKHVFQELFNNANKTKVPQKPALSFFNRQQNIPTFSRSSSKIASNNLIRKEKVLQKRENSSSSVPERNRTVNLKNQARSPFQKPSNTQLTSKSKASFSTISKIPKITGPTSVSQPKLLKKNKNIISSSNIKTCKRPITTIRNEKEETKPAVKKTLYSTLGYYPAIPKTIELKPIKKIKNIKNKPTSTKKKESKKENKSHTQSANSNNGYFSQRRSLSSFGVQIGSITETDKPIKTLTEPLNEEVFKEVMDLCKGQPPEKKKVPSSEKEKSLKRYGRCSVQEKKKPERRRGFVCRLATMLNIGCGRRRRHNQGCQECGKKTS